MCYNNKIKRLGILEMVIKKNHHPFIIRSITASCLFILIFMINSFFLDDNYKTSSTEITKKTSADISLRSKDKTFYEMLSSQKV